MMGGNVADTFKLNSMPYRGMLTFSVNGSSMTGVNIIGLEEYLYGVVPSEMPKSYDAEALKAQAVAARTYAMTKLGAHAAAAISFATLRRVRFIRLQQRKRMPPQRR